MRRRPRLRWALAALLAVAIAAPAFAAAPEPLPPQAEVEHLRTGERVAEAFAIATGVPISPLLGVSALGAWRWWRTPPELRPGLPWYARPAWWGAGLALAFLFAANTTLGAALPGLKKPMDFVEQFENQVSGLVASPIVVLEIFRLMRGLPGLASAPIGPWSSAGVAALGGLPPALAPLVELGAGALALAAYALVFLAFHAVQVLIALSPSALLDLALRGFRAGVLLLAGMSISVHPYVGAIFGLFVLAVAAMIAGWAFRLLVFGSVFGRDILRPSTAGRRAHLTAFAARGLAGVPLRAYGRWVPGEIAGEWRFRWRPWLVLPARTAAIGGGDGLAIVRGALSPRAVRTGPLREVTLARFPPRFRGREEELAERLGGAVVKDGRIVRGLRASWRWLVELVLGGDAGDPATSGSIARR